MIWQIDDHLTIPAIVNQPAELGGLEFLACFYQGFVLIYKQNGHQFADARR
jgi:hypothetical protein